MREKIILALFMLSHIFSTIADALRTQENEQKEYRVSFMGNKGIFL